MLLMRRFVPAWLCALVLFSPPLAAQDGGARGTLVILLGGEATSPIPTLLQANFANQDVADQLFLRLARLGPKMETSGDKDFVPELARSWSRRDSLTLVFELDPRARWHDGVPVTAQDVVFTVQRTLEPGVDVQHATLFQYVESVSAEGDHRVVFRFKRWYPEQFYDAVFHVQPLPSHLVAQIPATGLAASDYARHPVGDGPFRWVRREPGQLIELAANDQFFLGKPGLSRLVFRFVGDQEARNAQLLSGEADATGNILPVSNVDRFRQNPELRIIPVPSLTIGYLLFNQRDRADTSRPHPILADPAVRRALTLAIDRRRIIQSVFGPGTDIPVGPVSLLLSVRDTTIKPLPFDVATARSLLRSHGWEDHDGDGILDRDGHPLALTMNFPGTATILRLVALQVQEQLRQFGVKVDAVPLSPGDFMQRSRAGNFDLQMSAVTQDPTPSGIRQSWTCGGIGGSNFARYCNPLVDSLIDAAVTGRSDRRARWRRAIAALNDDAPAIFLYTPTLLAVVHSRFRNVNLRPPSLWQDVWRWSVAPGRELDRDRRP